MYDDDQDTPDGREEIIRKEIKNKELRKKRQRFQFNLSISEAEVKRAERKKEDLETDLLKLGKDRDAITMSIEMKEREVKKMESEIAFQQGEVDMMKKKMNVLKE